MTLWALIIDTWHLLRGRRLFWLHLAFAILALVLLASVRCTTEGYSLWFGGREGASAWLKAGTVWEQTLYSWMHTRWMRWWVACGSLIMALFATAAVLPQSLESGSAALLLPKARRRRTLLWGRYLGGLFYAMVPTLISVVGAMLIWRWRVGEWHLATLWALPIVALLFSAFHAVATLMGVLTRSATAALMMAMLLAGAVWAIESALVSATMNRPETEVDEQDSGLGDLLGESALAGSAAIVPRLHEAMNWLEQEVIPGTPRPYGSLFRRLRAGRTGVEAVAAEAIAPTNGPARAVTPQKPQTVVVVLSLGVASLISMLLAQKILRRRDL
jgi:hypothetical protein